MGFFINRENDLLREKLLEADLKIAGMQSELDRITADANTLFCSFCGKSQHNVAKLIAGPRVFICNECVGLCVSIICETPKKKGGE